MNSASVTKGNCSGETELLKAVIFLAGAAFQLWSGLSENRWYRVLLSVILLVLGISSLRNWLAYRRGKWRVEWNGCRIKIHEDTHVCYDGELDGMHGVEKDGRGYFLYPTRDTVFRLRKGRSGEEFEAMLDGFRAESAAAESVRTLD